MDENIKSEEVFEENNTENDIKIDEKQPFFKRFSKKTIIFSSIFAAFLIIMVSVLLFFVFEITGKTLKEPISLEIQKGSASITVAETLKENKVIGSSLIFRVYSRINNFDSQFKYGNYTFEGK